MSLPLSTHVPAMLQPTIVLALLCALLLSHAHAHEPADEPNQGELNSTYQTFYRANSQVTTRAAVQRPSNSGPNTPTRHEYSGADVLADDGLIWPRLRRGFRLGYYEQPLIQARQKRYQQYPLHLRKVLERGEPYLHYIVEATEKRGLPLELALLPAIESGFNPQAYSSGHAAGLWQFMATTGKRYGLHQDFWYDGRRDVVASTDAALDYLQYLHGRFDNWLLAIAAYNAGEGKIIRARAKNRKAGLPIDFWHLPLPKETRHYVPHVLALAAIIWQPEAYGVTLRPIANEPQLAVLDLPRQFDLLDVQTTSELPLKQLMRLNPGYRRWASPPDGPHRLVLPLASSATVTAALAEQKQPVTWRRHRIKSGETLKTLAKRLHSNSAAIKAVNQLDGNSIAKGDLLVVPEGLKQLQPSWLERNKQLARLQKRVQPRRKIVHQVKDGDTLWDVARKYRVSTRKLVAWNRLNKKSYLRPGQKLVIYQGAKSVAPKRTKTLIYTVKTGDSLWTIARRFRVRVDDIRSWNKLSKKGFIRPGKRLKLRLAAQKS